METGCVSLSEQCRDLVWACFDPRQWSLVKEFLHQQGIVNGRLHRMSGIGGGVFPLTRATPDVRAYHANCVRVAVTTHGVQNIILVNHEQCGMYANANLPNTTAFHGDEIREAAAYLHATFPALSIRGYVCALAADRQRFCPELRLCCTVEPTMSRSS